MKSTPKNNKLLQSKIDITGVRCQKAFKTLLSGVYIQMTVSHSLTEIGTILEDYSSTTETE